MRALLYHDVAPRDEWHATGFEGGDAAVYKFEHSDFERHLDALAGTGRPPALVTAATPDNWLITFDDGGASALKYIAPALEARGWRGHFFMTVGRLGTPQFLNVDGIQELHRRGHIVGSHTVTHPLQMSSCSVEQLRREWAESSDVLADILHERPTVASVPTSRTWQVGPVRCIGRFTLWNGMPPAAACACATGRGIWPMRQLITWETKKLAKAMLGSTYVRVRKRILDSRLEKADA